MRRLFLDILADSGDRGVVNRRIRERKRYNLKIDT